MSSPRPDDQSLRDRLNALKPTSAVLERPINTAVPLPQGAQPAAKEDVLAARLRFLRSQSSGRNRRGSQPSRLSQDSVADTAPQPAAEPSGAPRDRQAAAPKGAAVSRETLPLPIASTETGPGQSPSRFLGADAEDEEALEELLESLADEQFDLAADLDSDVARHSGRGGNSRDHVSSKGNDDDDDDDSDGEKMTRAVESILSQITDEMKSLPSPTLAPDKSGIEPRRQPAPVETQTGNDSCRKDAIHAMPEPSHAPEPTLSLPSVPSQLVDSISDAAGGAEEDDFERDISARLASLRGLGSVDSLGLPSAPTFRPQDRPLGIGLLTSSKYTDEDQKTWCVVCLEDATIRCIGCDNDAYCGRCWRDMHVGPAAGYDERGHQWVKFEKSSLP
ncbi:hypothetical protein VTK26DRAFT_7523 [Humicola hyalothermophila]